MFPRALSVCSDESIFQLRQISSFIDLWVTLTVSAESVLVECWQKSVSCVTQRYQFKCPHETVLLRFYFPLDFSAVLHELGAIDFTLREMYLVFNYPFY